MELQPNLWLLESNMIPMTKVDRRKMVIDFLLSLDHRLFLKHKSTGVPFLSNSPQLHVSISYAQNYGVVYFGHQKMVGVDIQEHEPRLEKALSVFLTPHEQELLHSDPILYTTAWSAKEAVFKRFEGEFSSLLKEITLLELGKTSAKVQTPKGIIRLKVLPYKNGIITFTID